MCVDGVKNGLKSPSQSVVSLCVRILQTVTQNCSDHSQDKLINKVIQSFKHPSLSINQRRVILPLLTGEVAILLYYILVDIFDTSYIACFMLIYVI